MTRNMNRIILDHRRDGGFLNALTERFHCDVGWILLSGEGGEDV
jgi:hypothetical protein